MILRSSRAAVCGLVFFALPLTAAELDRTDKTKPVPPDKTPTVNPVERLSAEDISPVLLPRPRLKPEETSATKRLPHPANTTSAALSAAIRAGLPKFAGQKADIEPTLDNEVLLLPKIEVSGDRIRLPSAADVLTKAGKQQALQKLHPGASPRELEEEQRKIDLEELNDFSATLRTVGRAAESKVLNREIQRAFMRRPSWKDEAVDKAYNGGNR